LNFNSDDKSLLLSIFPSRSKKQFELQKDLKVNGESMASNRKNKLIAYWDYSLELKFKLKHKGNEVECECSSFLRAYPWIRYLAKGTIKCPNFSQENDPDEWDLTSTKYDKDEHYDAEGLKFIKAKAHPVMRDKMEVRNILKLKFEMIFNHQGIRETSPERLCSVRLSSDSRQYSNKISAVNNDEYEKGWAQQARWSQEINNDKNFWVANQDQKTFAQGNFYVHCRRSL